MEEIRVINEAQKGSVTAFNQLVMAYQGTAYNVAYRVIGNGDAAADACQEAFLKAYQAIKQYRGGSFKSWLLRIVTNTCYDQMRYKSRRPTTSLENLAENAEDPGEKLVNGSERPEESILRGELNDLIQLGINHLPEDQRLVLVLSDVQGFSYQEIAEIVGQPLGTVKSRLSRGVAAPRPFTLTEADVKGATAAPKGFFDWPVWVRSMAGLAATLLCIVAAAGIFLTLQRGGASPQAAEVANAPALAPTAAPAAQSVEAPAAAPPGAAQAESAYREQPAQAAPATAEAMADAAQEEIVAATPSPTATMADALVKPSSNEVAAEPAAPAGEVPAAEGESITATQADESASAEQVTAAEAPALQLTATPSPTSTVLTFAAPAEEPAPEEAAGSAEADTNQKA
ncbi:MAG: sigma-70 family RNA polymerase sigma factor, partial [Chloroflexi bacterium]|nr:sigma-70 family RNA polymerase sigma factor [Chloroflexota bacterium]